MNLLPLAFDPVLAVARDMRPADRREIYATRWDEDPESLAADCVNGCGIGAVLAGRDGVPIAVVAAMEMWPTVWSVWMFATNRWHEVALDATRFVKERMARAMLDLGLRRAECRSAADHHQAHRWLIHLGAEREAEHRDYVVGDEVHVLIQNAGPSITGITVGVGERELILAVGGLGWLPSTKTVPSAIANVSAANWVVKLHLLVPRSAGVLGLPWSSRGGPRSFVTDARLMTNVISVYQSFQCPLGRRAVIVRPMGRCVVPNNGYSPGDTIALGQVSFNSSDPMFITVGNDLRMEVSSSGFTGIVPSAGGSPVAMAAGQWQLYVQGLA